MNEIHTENVVVRNENPRKKGAAKYIVGGCIVALGILLVTIAVCIDGFQLFTHFPEVNIGPFGVRVYYSPDDYNISSGGINVMQSSDIKNIKLDIDYGKVIIQRGNVETIDIQTNNIVEERFKWAVDGDTLRVRYKKGFTLFSFNIFGRNEKILITLPKDAVYDDLEIDNGAGEMLVSDLEVKTVDIDNGAGELRLENVTAEGKVDMETGAGAMRIDGMTCKNLIIQTGVGEVNLTDVSCEGLKASSGVGAFTFKGRIDGDADIENGVGEIRMNLSGNSGDYGFKVDSGIGKVRVNGNTPVQTSGAKYDFKVSTGIGEVRIDFEEE